VITEIRKKLKHQDTQKYYWRDVVWGRIILTSYKNPCTLALAIKKFTRAEHVLLGGKHNQLSKLAWSDPI